MANVNLKALQAAIDASGKSASAVALAAGLSITTVRDILRQKSKNPSVTTLSAISAVLDVPLRMLIVGETVLEEKIFSAPGGFLSVKYNVQAGAWFEYDNSSQVVGGEYPVAENPKYAGHDQWLERVVGDSVNLVIPDGSLAHVVDAISIELEPADGQLVVVERTRDGGHIQERTIKEVRHTLNGIELWPRSTNPKFQTPITIADGRSGESEVRIAGLVIGSYRPL
jgi:transcriptional regulator with XRE-family HTH domain